MIEDCQHTTSELFGFSNTLILRSCHDFCGDDYLHFKESLVIVQSLGGHWF